MRKTNVKPPQKRRRIIFCLAAPDAGQVFVVGDFNHWNIRKHPMKREDNGVWKKTTLLKPGKYEYKFLVDGVWQNDPECEEMLPNCFGTHNNVIDVIA